VESFDHGSNSLAERGGGREPPPAASLPYMATKGCAFICSAKPLITS
jgi:hypothetical protein